jgi:hypothetical protein
MSLGLIADEAHRDKYAAKGIIMDDGTLNNWAVPFESSHMGLFECGHQFSAIDENSISGMSDMVQEGLDICYKTPFSLGWAFFSSSVIGPHCGNFQTWMQKIKKAFDPNIASDTANYVSMEGK